MEFMIKTQGNDGIGGKPSLMQAREFVCVTSKDKFCIECWCDGDDENYFYQSYATEQRRDEVFEQLEKWITEMIRLSIHREYRGEKVIFEFPIE